MRQRDPILRLHHQCVITRGPFRSLLIDLDRRRYETIPNDMYDLLERLREQPALPWTKILAPHEDVDRAVLEEYKVWLQEGEYIHECTSELLEGLRPVPLHYESPFALDGAIIDLSADSSYSLRVVLDQLNDLCCKSVHIRDFDGTNLGMVREAVLSANASFICNIHLLLRSTSMAYPIALELLDSPRVASVVMHGCDEEFMASIKATANMAFVGTTNVVEHECSCGSITPSYFLVNHRCVSQSLLSNTCLYKKVGVDRFGWIKNCPSMTTSFGHVSSNSIAEVISMREFQSLWNISKDQIDICKICGFRMICTDCRAYRKEENNPYSKPLKCAYDPHTATWVA